MQAMPKAREACLTAAEVRRLLRYDADTGLFYWQVDTKNTSAGEVAGSQQSRGYWHIKINRRLYMAYRLAWLYVTGEWPIGHIDHISGNRSDNRFGNLRVATNSENARNSRRRIDNACGYKGVHYKTRLNKFLRSTSTDGFITGRLQNSRRSARCLLQSRKRAFRRVRARGLRACRPASSSGAPTMLPAAERAP
jgi:hypothetical protein